MNRKIIFSIIIVFLSGLFIHNNVIAQINRPFGACYQAAFSGCSNCSDSTIESKTFQYAGCNVTVTYKKMTCNCPQPTTFVDIEYMRLDRSNSFCENLMCNLYPNPNIPTPPCPYDPSHINLNEYKALARAMYDSLVFALFQEVQNNYLCPNNYFTYKVYWPASCNAVCQITLVEKPDLILITKPCNAELCCSLTYKFCYNGHNSWNSIVEQIGYGQNICYLPWGTNCDYQAGDEIILPDGNFHVLNATISDCTAFCDNPK